MQKILITGKNGLISLSLAKWLEEKFGYKTELLSVRGEEWKNADFSSFDSVVHVAGVVPKEGVKSEDFYEINYRLTEVLADKAKKEGVKRFVYISSMAVYGIEPEISVKKGTVCIETKENPTSDYGKSKFLTEQYLEMISDADFKLTVIRVPSVYGEGKTEYTDQYLHLADKLPLLPRAFADRYKSMICVDNLCQLVGMTIEREKDGIICPDDGKISAYYICKILRPEKKSSRLLGLAFKLLSKSDRIRDYFGACCYSEELTEVFGGEYRVVKVKDALEKCYL